MTSKVSVPAGASVAGQVAAVVGGADGDRRASPVAVAVAGGGVLGAGGEGGRRPGRARAAGTAHRVGPSGVRVRRAVGGGVARAVGAGAGARGWSGGGRRGGRAASSARRSSTQTVASSPVVAGEKLKMPLSSVAYQVPGSIAPETSKARLLQAGQDAGLLEVVDAVGQHAGGDEIRNAPVQVKNLAQVDRERAAVEQVAEHHRGGEAERGAEQRLPVGAAPTRRGCRPGWRPRGTARSPGPRGRRRARRRRPAPGAAVGGRVDAGRAARRSCRARRGPSRRSSR